MAFLSLFSILRYMTSEQAHTKATKGWVVLVLIIVFFSVKGAFLSLSSILWVEF